MSSTVFWAKEAWPFYRTSSGVRLCWELEEPKGPKGKGPLCIVISYPPTFDPQGRARKQCGQCRGPSPMLSFPLPRMCGADAGCLAINYQSLLSPGLPTASRLQCEVRAVRSLPNTTRSSTGRSRAGRLQVEGVCLRILKYTR